nr:response regulator transcription factor [Prosthecomicrobium pneumaticum]
MTVAVIEDNDDLREAMLAALGSNGYRTIGFDSAEALIEHREAVRLDVLVIDIGLPGEDGISLAARIRATQPDVGIIMATARDRIADKQRGYGSGADIYLTKPVSLEELSAAIGALGRRIQRAAAPPPLTLDIAASAVRGPAGEAHLSLQEVALLAAFARAAGNKLETWQIVEILDRGEQELTRNAVNVAIFRLAAKLRQVGSDDKPIRSIRNWGYQFCDAIALR